MQALKNPFSNTTRRNTRSRHVCLERVATVLDLHEYLETHGHLEACEHVFSCDPWIYEPILLDDLTHEREHDARTDSERVTRLRKLIRAGSWMTYPRLRTEEILRVLAQARATERAMWESRIRFADPDTSKEHHEDFCARGALAFGEEDAMKEFDNIANAIAANLVGEDAEDATRAIDNLQRRFWISLKSVLAARNLTMKEARTDHVTRPLIHEIEQLRPIRDLLYHQRCYPRWARQSSQRS